MIPKIKLYEAWITLNDTDSILPLVVSSCGTTGCHDQTSHRDGIILTDYASILKTGKIKPGDPGDCLNATLSFFKNGLMKDIPSRNNF